MSLVEHAQDDAPKFLGIYYRKRIRRRKRNSSAYSLTFLSETMLT